MSSVRYFWRVLDGAADEMKAQGWTEAFRDRIPSLSEEIVMLERDHLPGAKHDDGKDRWDLLLQMLGPQARQVVRALMYGATKYKENPEDPNYRKVTDGKRRFCNASVRHIVDFLDGNRIDAESGHPNLALATVSLLFAMWHDDNPQE